MSTNTGRPASPGSPYAVPWITAPGGAMHVADPFALGCASALLLGKAGTGKTTAAYLWLARLLARGGQAVILDAGANRTAPLERLLAARGQMVHRFVVPPILPTTPVASADLPGPVAADLVVYATHQLLPDVWATWTDQALQALAHQRGLPSSATRPLVVLLDDTMHPNYRAIAATLRATQYWPERRMYLWLVVGSLDQLVAADLLPLWETAGILALFRQVWGHLQMPWPAVQALLAAQGVPDGAALGDRLEQAPVGAVLLRVPPQPIGWGRVRALDAAEQALIGAWP